MKKCLLFTLMIPTFLFGSVIIPADNPNIQYYGRWDFSSPTAPTHSWPGVYVFAVFEGTSIGIRTNDNGCWYNVIIDGEFKYVFKGTSSSVTSYTLASGLKDTIHTILFTKRGETTWTKFSFNGFILDDGKNLLPPPAKPERKIEFIGDSYTSASGNEWTETGAPPNDSYTNIYKGFGPITARYFNAQYHMTSRSGFGLVCDWQGNASNNIPDYFDRALYYSSTPKWDFSKWIPNLVVICLGLNDASGLGVYSGQVTADNTLLFKRRYHEFIATIMDVYPGAKILAVAANNVDWIKQQASEVVAEENAMGNKNVFYTYFPYYDGEYVNNGHPNPSAHQKIADVLISVIDTIDAWTPYQDTIKPYIVSMPDMPLTVTTTNYSLVVKTSTYATVRYSTEDKPYNQMENTFTITGTRNHSTLLSCVHGENYTYYIRAIDSYGNMMDTSAVIQFVTDTTKIVVKWQTFAYDHSVWKSGTAPLRNDDSLNTATRINNCATAYFAKSFDISNPTVVPDFRVKVKGHDGAVVFLNGTLIGRINMPTAMEYAYNAYASKSYTMNDSVILSFINPLTFLKYGKNIVTIEVHSPQVSSPTVAFDAKIYDKNGNIYSDFNSDWYYYDGGRVPPDQLKDKTTNVIYSNNNFIPVKTELFQNYPNPFNPSTTIRYQLAEDNHVSLKIFDLLGREITTLVDKKQLPGSYSVQFDAKNSKHTISSGVYFYRLNIGESSLIKRMIVLK